MNFRTGQGIDFHRLVTGRNLWLGGMMIPSEKGCLAHSDGDVLIHAICDALLGAAGLRDIGYYFPDSNQKYKNIDSKILLREVVSMIDEMEYEIVNLDTTVCLEEPKLSEYIEEIKKSLAAILGIGTGEISVKATTTEKMGFTGRGEGIIALATVLISKKGSN